MIAEAVDYVQMIDQLPHQGTLVLYDVPWDEYEDLIVQMESRPGCRVTYNNGVLKIRSPRSDHEFPKEVISSLVRIYADEFDVMLEA